ncbi:hypothetical protein EX30DRAFT_244647 [Ascodesmis nigricans]|uniref:Uncharacterized protein n=1 Tax=Ascodesmis nigricans TaxID=341454 RepID=A0A4S2MI30_9PEZI|nr:hypothetical protein EX30DRAFT_244647 [Ascodesmis nigricans]
MWASVQRDGENETDKYLSIPPVINESRIRGYEILGVEESTVITIQATTDDNYHNYFKRHIRYLLLMLFTSGLHGRAAGFNTSRVVPHSLARGKTSLPAAKHRYLHTTLRHAAKVATETPSNAPTTKHWLTHPAVILGAGTVAAGVGLRGMLKATEKSLAEEPRNVKTVGAGKAGGE